jgi:3-hydroxyacyl-[acyl-carrier-protein] dehydratase
MPHSLVIEGMAQTAGILVGEARDFTEKVILAKIKRATFDGIARPGSQIRYEARIESLANEAALTTGQVFCDGQPFAEIDLMFSHVDQNMSGLNFPKENFVFTDEFKSLLRTYQADMNRRSNA